MNSKYKSQGFSMMEILITLIIIAVGLLGLAALETRSQQAEFESYQRSQALILLDDMVNRLNTNRDAAGCYQTTAATTGGTYVGAGTTAITACTAYGGGALTRAMADEDLSQWDSMLKGAGEKLNSNSVGSMIDARGCITRDVATNSYTVSVAWQGSIDTIAPATNTCGQGLYTAETKRRVVSEVVRFADLG
jgi:type IV pilus assembly protein PilV